MAIDTKVIERVISIEASPETVFRLLTDPNQYTRWKGELAELEPRPGGKYRVTFAGDYGSAAGSFVELVPNRRVVFTWGWEGNENVPPGSSTVEIQSKEQKKLLDFYGKLFDWHMDTNNPMGYAMVDTHAGKGIGAGIGATQNGRNFITFYVDVNDLDATLEKAEGLGGKTVLKPTQAGPVTVAMFADPEGNVVGIAKGM